jgi:hypothetical protein
MQKSTKVGPLLIFSQSQVPTSKNLQKTKNLLVDIQLLGICSGQRIKKVFRKFLPELCFPICHVSFLRGFPSHVDEDLRPVKIKLNQLS